MRFKVLITIGLLVLSASMISNCSEPSRYDKAFSLFNETYKKHGKLFFRMEEYKTVMKNLESITRSQKDYKNARDLIEKLKSERLKYREESVRAMMGATRKRFEAEEQIKNQIQDKGEEKKPYSEMTEEDKRVIEGK